MSSVFNFTFVPWFRSVAPYIHMHRNKTLVLGVPGEAIAAGKLPSIVKVGLPDILLPVGSKHALDHAIQDREQVVRLSRDLGLVGVHMFCCPNEGTPTAHCRNFAPLFGIDEESATGTSNASLTHYLNAQGRIVPDAINTFAQGEAMGKPSQILSKVDGRGNIWIGGNAVISVAGEINID